MAPRLVAVQGDLTVDNVAANGKAATGRDINALEETNVGGSVRSDMGHATGAGGWTSVGSKSDQSVTVGEDVTLTALTGFLAAGDFNNDGLEVRNARVAGGVTMDLGKGAGNTALFGIQSVATFCQSQSRAPAGSVSAEDTSTSLLTRSGCRAAKTPTVIEPREWPTRSAFWIPSASMKAPRSCASVSIP